MKTLNTTKIAWFEISLELIDSKRSYTEKYYIEKNKEQIHRKYFFI